jgi:hypothetical protein
MANTPVLPPNRHVPYKKGGWGAALLTIAAAVGAFLTAFYIHTKTYRDPQDVMMRAVGDQPAPHQTAGGPAPATPAPATPAH